MTSSWKPSEGMRRAELLVQVLEVEALAADSKIGPLFRHRLVQHIAKALDDALPRATETNQGAVVPMLQTIHIGPGMPAEQRITLPNGTAEHASAPVVAAAEVEKTKKRGRGRPRRAS